MNEEEQSLTHRDRVAGKLSMTEKKSLVRWARGISSRITAAEFYVSRYLETIKQWGKPAIITVSGKEETSPHTNLDFTARKILPSRHLLEGVYERVRQDETTRPVVPMKRLPEGGAWAKGLSMLRRVTQLPVKRAVQEMRYVSPQEVGAEAQRTAQKAANDCEALMDNLLNNYALFVKSWEKTKTLHPEFHPETMIRNVLMVSIGLSGEPSRERMAQIAQATGISQADWQARMQPYLDDNNESLGTAGGALDSLGRQNRRGR